MRMQGKDFIPSIIQKLSDKGDLSPIGLPRHQAPTEKVVMDYMIDCMRWGNKMNASFQNRRIKELEKLNNDFFRVAFPLSKGGVGVHTNGFDLPQLKDLKRIKRISDPYHIPDIGGKDGILTHLLRSIPVGQGTCYKNAAIIASAIQGVKVVYGLYPLNGGGVKKTSKGLSASEQIAIERMKIQQEQTIQSFLKYRRSLGNNWYYGPLGFKEADPSLEYIESDKLNAWTLHAWCSYKGYHFDPFLYNIHKRYGTTRNWYSTKKKKFISWIEYFMIKETDIFQLTNRQLKRNGIGKNIISEDVRKDIFLYLLNGTMKQCYGLIYDHMQLVKTNRHHMDYGAFPVKIPSKRKWIKNKELIPPGLFSNQKVRLISL